MIKALSFLHIVSLSFLVLLCYLTLFFACVPSALASYYGHTSHQHLHYHDNLKRIPAQARVDKALEALRIANKLRVENYQVNKYEFNTTGTQP
jgi:hypothetical protein